MEAFVDEKEKVQSDIRAISIAGRKKKWLMLFRNETALCLLSLSIAQNRRFDSCHLIRHPPQKDFPATHRWMNLNKFFSFQVDFGEVFIPPGLDVPRPRVLPEFKRLAHGLRSSNISVLDAKTFYIPNLHYDGAGPDACNNRCWCNRKIIYWPFLSF